MTNSKNDFEFSPADKVNGFWLRFKAHLEQKLAAARVKNDRVGLTDQQTSALRGEIKCLKTLIRLDADRPLTGDDE